METGELIRRLLDVEVFMYAGPGYGTLQEYLALDRYLPEVRPDLVLVQLCRNDAVNNLWALERSSYLNNNLMVRPYLEGERIVGDYRALFAMDGRTVFVLHVRHGQRQPATKQDLAPALGELRPRLLR